MPSQIAGPHSTARVPGAAPGAAPVIARVIAPVVARGTVMLTGASGVVGRALLRRLRDFDVVCLVHHWAARSGYGQAEAGWAA